ncbi:DUF6069 family protein [Nocardia sp. NBC_01377]|uniref:DUF6069 family protein n=1 Tax=Nocardia sp. NBC_01377 TaxID=2903595 RepID=UPI00324F240A
MSVAQPADRVLPIPALNRPTAVFGGIAVALVLNLIVWLIGAAAGGEFTSEGEPVAPGGVIVMSIVPLLIGLGAAALLSYKWVAVLRVAAVVGSLLALGTIALTVAAEFDTASTVALSLMHVVLVPVIIVATEGLHRKLTRS